MRRAGFLALCAAASALLLPRAPAQEPVSLKDVKLGEFWYGSRLSPEDLKGRVVLFELWGLK